jgi:hypothetical protein
MVTILSKWPKYTYSFESAEELNSLLTEFNHLVQEKTYNKMAYSDWRKLTALSKSQTPFIYLDYDAKEHEIFIYTGETHLVPLAFNTNDKSFGEFIVYNANILDTKEDNKSMYLNDCGISYTNKVNDTTDATSAKSATVYCDLSASPSYVHDTGYDNTVSNCITNAIKASDCIYSLNDNSDSLTAKVINVEKLEDRVEKLEKTVKKQNDSNKEDKKMKGFNFDFGPVNGDKVRMSIYGIAVKNNAGTYVSFNPQTQEIIDVDILNFDGEQFLYKMPVAINAIRTGDVVIHSRKPMFVEVVNATDITVVDVYEGERKNIMPTKSPFGFNFMTKVVSIMDMVNGGNAPSMENPFGNMLPFMMLNQKDGNKDDFNPIMLMLMMNQQGATTNMNMVFPLLMARKNSQMDLDMLFMMMAMNGGMGTMMNGALTPSNNQTPGN